MLQIELCQCIAGDPVEGLEGEVERREIEALIAPRCCAQGLKIGRQGRVVRLKLEQSADRSRQGPLRRRDLPTQHMHALLVGQACLMQTDERRHTGNQGREGNPLDQPAAGKAAATAIRTEVPRNQPCALERHFMGP